MRGTIQNREVFMETIAHQFGRNSNNEVKRPVWAHRPQDEVMKSASIEDLVFVLNEHCKRIHTDFYQTSVSDLPTTLRYVMDDFGGGAVIIPKDNRFLEYGLSRLENNAIEDIHVDVWDYTKGRENIQVAERANIGITFSEITLAESATVVLFSDRDKGRSVCMLPKTHISIIPKSSIVPRMTQAAQLIRKKVKNGNILPSCINFITGPSNSADIEMNLVVGVHGPVRAAYIIVEDK